MASIRPPTVAEFLPSAIHFCRELLFIHQFPTVRAAELVLLKVLECRANSTSLVRQILDVEDVGGENEVLFPGMRVIKMDDFFAV